MCLFWCTEWIDTALFISLVELSLIHSTSINPVYFPFQEQANLLLCRREITPRQKLGINRKPLSLPLVQRDKATLVPGQPSRGDNCGISDRIRRTSDINPMQSGRQSFSHSVIQSSQSASLRILHGVLVIARCPSLVQQQPSGSRTTTTGCISCTTNTSILLENYI